MSTAALLGPHRPPELPNRLLTKVAGSLQWAYKAYADVEGTLLKVAARGAIDGVAAADATGKALRVVLGLHHSGGAGPHTLRLINLDKAPWLVRDGRTHLRALWIPDSGQKPLLRPVVTFDGPIQSPGKELTITLSYVRNSDAYFVELSPPRQAVGRSCRRTDRTCGLTNVEWLVAPSPATHGPMAEPLPKVVFLRTEAAGRPTADRWTSLAWTVCAGAVQCCPIPMAAGLPRPAANPDTAATHPDAAVKPPRSPPAGAALFPACRGTGATAPGP